MKKKYLMATMLMIMQLYMQLHAQQLSPQTINNTGSSKTAGGILLEDALGGFVINSISNPVILYTQDFLQPGAGTTTTPPIINNVALSSGSGLDNAGTTFTAGNAMLEFTVGEFASITISQNNTLLTQGILQPFRNNGALPVIGLEFYAKRLNNATVQLDWKTIQEINNKGFHIERKKENESAFNEVAFVNSKASNGGNSSFPSEYQKLDNNNFSGNTYYRLKQEDIDGRATFSVVRIVKGDSKQLTMQVWPVPAVGFFNVNINGLTKADVLQVLDMNGRLVKQFTIQNQTQQQVSGLPAGIYYIKLASDNIAGQKVIIQ